MNVIKSRNKHNNNSVVPTEVKRSSKKSAWLEENWLDRVCFFPMSCVYKNKNRIYSAHVDINLDSNNKNILFSDKAKKHQNKKIHSKN